ncbi:hypothetical protein KAR91_34620 [Candidatus Pacearchaeota archaeon]|nr:hypothetical protein [Candidatus Pacearchaeota archaeon]
MNEEQYNLLRNIRDNAEMKMKDMYPEFKDLKTRFLEFEQKYGELWRAKDNADRAMAIEDGRLKRYSSSASGIAKPIKSGSAMDVIIRNLSARDVSKLANQLIRREEDEKV